MVATFGKGIMACDESPGTVGDRFAKVGIDNTEENRRLYRCVILFFFFFYSPFF
jgi:fructose-bisphosphate aldolase class I